MDRLAGAVIKHSKLIVALWIVILLASAPFAYLVIAHPDEYMSYDLTRSIDSEASQGNAILRDKQIFDSDLMDYAIVVEFKDSSQKAGVQMVKDRVEELFHDAYRTGYSVKLVLIEPEEKGVGIITTTVPEGFGSKDAMDMIRNGIIDLRESKGDVIGTTYVTSGAAIANDTASSALRDVVTVDPFVILLVLLIIGLFFRSFVAAAAPPFTIGISFALVLSLIFMMSEAFEIFYITSTVALVSMLGAGCDYCIFIIARYRDERRSGKNSDDALFEAVKWAGESVMISGLCVIIAFGMMSFCSYSVLNAIGVILASAIVFALLAALTLMPAIIHLVGDRIFYPTKLEDYGEDSKVMEGWYGKCSRLGKRYFASSIDLSMKHAKAILVACIIISVPLTYVAVTEKTSFDMVSTMPDSEAKSGIAVLEQYGYGGMVMPTHLIVRVDGKIADITEPTEEQHYGLLTWTSDDDAKKLMFGTSYFHISGLMSPVTGLSMELYRHTSFNKNVSSMIGMMSSKALIDYVEDILNKYKKEEGPWTFDKTERFILDNVGSMSPEYGTALNAIHDAFPDDTATRMKAYDYYLNVDNSKVSKYVDGHQYIDVSITVKEQPMSDKSMGVVRDVRTISHYYLDNQQLDQMPEIAAVYTCGTAALLNDTSDLVSDEFTIIEIAVIILILVLLLFVMRSYVTPIRSMVTILMGFAWSLGLTHLIFGHALNQPIIWLIPILMFVICIGLGMDYDVLLTTRIKEYVSKGMDNDTAIRKAMEHSGSIITVCGILMGGTYLSLLLSTTPLLQQFGFAIGFTILVDALIIRTYVVPAAMHLLGKWNWVGPRFGRQ